jgi:hypothetical protein
MPAATTPRSYLAAALRLELQHTPTGIEAATPDILYTTIWVHCLGGIAAADMPERVWYIGELTKYVARAQLGQWLDRKRTLKDILWLDSACDSAGQQLWKEVLQCSRRQNRQMEITDDVLRLMWKNDRIRYQPCARCRIKKTTCDKQMPCISCTKYGVLCYYRKVLEEVDKDDLA